MISAGPVQTAGASVGCGSGGMGCCGSGGSGVQV